MEIKEVEIPITRGDKVRIWCVGDIHSGTKYTDEEALVKTISRIEKDDRAFFVDMGDRGDFITPRDPRWENGGISEWVDKEDIAQSQLDWLKQRFDRIAKKNLGALEGTHEGQIHQYNNNFVHRKYCEMMGFNNLGFACFLRVHLRRTSSSFYSIDLYLTHGSGSARRKPEKLRKLLQMEEDFQADIYAMGHLHDIIKDEKQYLVLSKSGRLVYKSKAGAITGSYLRTYTEGVSPSYAERRNYSPTDIGSVYFEVEPETGRITVT